MLRAPGEARKTTRAATSSGSFSRPIGTVSTTRPGPPHVGLAVPRTALDLELRAPGRETTRIHLEPEDLVGTVLYLASDASRFVTGQTLAVDGGTVFS